MVFTLARRSLPTHGANDDRFDPAPRQRSEAMKSAERLGPVASVLPDRATLAVQARVLQTARDVDYSGFSKHDALNAPWMERLAGSSRLRRLAFIQLVMRAPWHVRPW